LYPQTLPVLVFLIYNPLFHKIFTKGGVSHTRVNFKIKVLNFCFLCKEVNFFTKTNSWPKTIIKDPTHHPQPQRGYRAALLGQNMTQNGTKNSLKQPKTTKLALPSVTKSQSSKYRFLYIFVKSFFQSTNPTDFSLSYLQPTLPQNPHLRVGIPLKVNFQKMCLFLCK
jgi:hypothetical protein